MRALSVRVVVGKYEFRHAVGIRIESAWSELSDTCTIELPAFGRFSGNPGSWEKVAPRAGDEVEVWLGYDGSLEKEFTGYVKSFDYKIPYRLQCEGESYRLKRQKPISKSWANTTLKEVLAFILSGTDATVSGNVPDVALAPFSIRSATPAEALKRLADEYIFAAYFRQKTLFVGLPYTESMPSAFYALNGKRGNVNSDSGLSYRTEDERRIKVKAISILADNTRIEVDDVGDADGELRTLHFRNIKSKDALRKMATQQLSLLKYEGYDGSFTAYGSPYVSHGYSVDLEDVFFPERAGKYIVDSVTTTFGNGGFRREVQIGKRL